VGETSWRTGNIFEEKPPFDGNKNLAREFAEAYKLQVLR